MKKIMALVLSMVMLLSLAACSKNETKEATAPTTTAATEPAEEMEHYDLTKIDLEGIGELFSQKETETLCKIQLDGLCTPVVLELEGTNLVSISAYGNTILPDQTCAYTGIYGNLYPELYDHEGMIFLNIWHDDTGYSCVFFPDGTHKETYPDEDYSTMIYLDEEKRMCQSKFALKFVGLEQWDTAPIDMAASRDDFYYSIDDASWTKEEGYTTAARESYTISDWFELDEIFDTAKNEGLYPEFETVDELLAYNAQRFEDAQNEDPSNAPDSVEEKVGYFDQYFASYLYDDQHNLLTETFYDCFEEIYFTKTHTYDALNRETGGSWSFGDQEVYRYTHTYNKSGLITETVWYQADQEVERFSYTHKGDGSYTKTFSQNGQKKYTYTFDATGTLTAHSIYQNGQEIKTQDVTTLVQTQQLTDLWLPPWDNAPQHYPQYYNGTVPTEDPAKWNVTPAHGGGRILTQSSVDEEDGLLYTVEHHYDQKDRLVKVIYKQENREYSREEYEYVGDICVRQVGYDQGIKEYTCENEYNIDGQLICSKTSYVNPQSYELYTDENGVIIEQEVTYTTRAETYRYNDQGLLVETVIYEDEEESDRITYDYDVNGNILPRLDTYQYVYNVEGKPEGIWLIYEDHAVGMALIRCHTVYVTADNARQLQEIMRTELSWF